MKLTDFIQEGYIILVAVLNVIGIGIKQTNLIPDRFIPISLIILGGILGVFTSIDLPLIDSVFQGVLCAGVAVLGNEVVKQYDRED